MSQCGIRRFDKHRQTSERPTDPALHQEQQQRLSALLQERDAQDKGTFTALSSVSNDSLVVNMEQKVDVSHYTPWRTPSTN